MSSWAVSLVALYVMSSEHILIYAAICSSDWPWNCDLFALIGFIFYRYRHITDQLCAMGKLFLFQLICCYPNKYLPDFLRRSVSFSLFSFHISDTKQNQLTPTKQYEILQKVSCLSSSLFACHFKCFLKIRALIKYEAHRFSFTSTITATKVPTKNILNSTF